jgi:hypothetical protein
MAYALLARIGHKRHTNITQSSQFPHIAIAINAWQSKTEASVAMLKISYEQMAAEDLHDALGDG